VKALDRFLQRARIGQAERYIRPGDRLLDIGCFDRALLDLVAPRVQSAVGIDPLAHPWASGTVRVVRGAVPGDHPFEPESFDSITLLAVLEHVLDKESLARECAALLVPGGRLIMTVPKPAVDTILAVLRRVRLIDGMSVEEHHGFDVRRTPAIFCGAGFRLVHRRPFQLGLNTLFVFQNTPAGSATTIDRCSSTDPAHTPSSRPASSSWSLSVRSALSS
jgi:SAM-dependent methyltransferase